MQFDLSEETREIQRLVERLTTQFQMPLEQRMLDGEELSVEDFRPGREAAQKQGLWGLRLPADYGGADLSLVNEMAVREEATRCLAPLDFGGRVFLPLLYSNDYVKEKYLSRALSDDLPHAFAQTETGGGSDPGSSVKTKAVLKGDKWVINGHKVWISYVANAKVIYVVALTDAESGRRGGMTILAVDKDNPGLKLGRTMRTLGGFDAHELFFDDCEVDKDAIVGAGEGAGFQAAQDVLCRARFDVGATALGIASRAYDMMVDYAKQRELFGELLSERQAVQSMIVDSYLEIKQFRLLMYQGAEKFDAGHDIRVEASMVKMLGSELSGRVVDRAIQIHGAAGVTLDNPLAIWHGLQRPSRIYEGPSDVHKYRVIARHLLS